MDYTFNFPNTIDNELLVSIDFNGLFVTLFFQDQDGESLVAPRHNLQQVSQ